MSTIRLAALVVTVAATGAALAAADQPTARPPAQQPQTTSPQRAGDAAPRAGTSAATRDWTRVDANHDHLVSPEEMEAYLKANPGPLAHPAGTGK